MSEVSSISLEEELKKNPELKKSDVESLKEWCKKQPHLPEICDSSLALFLHCNYYRIESAKLNIENYYTLRMHVPEFFSNRDPLGNENNRHVFNQVIILPLKQTTDEGYNILFIQFIDPDPSNFVFQEYLKYIHTVVDLWIYQSGTNKGHIVIVDVKNFSFGHASRVDVMLLKKFLIYLQNGLPVRLKGIHYINVTPALESILKIMKPLMRNDILQMVYTHSSVKNLEKFLPIKCLPKELGGKAGTLKELHAAEIQELEKFQKWFIEFESKSQVDETKRIGKMKSESEMFGVGGSFKKIDID